MEGKPPSRFWEMMVALAALALSALGMLIAANKADASQAQENERRICRLEAIAAVGECKR